MKLDFTFDGEIKKWLEQYSAQMHLAVHLYSSAEEYHRIFVQNEHHTRMLDRFSSLPDVPDSNLGSYDNIITYLVRPLGIDSSQLRECVDRTLLSHFRKASKLPNTPLKGELSIIVARCVPPFLLEILSNFPRTELFNTSSE